MGLDMYLSRAKRIGNLSARDISNIDGYLGWKEKGAEYSLEDWCGVKEKDLARISAETIELYKAERFDRGYWSTVWEEVGYWRKANQIHNWFVSHVQNGVDDCGIYEVSKYQLSELLDTIKTILTKPTKAVDLLNYDDPETAFETLWKISHENMKTVLTSLDIVYITVDDEISITLENPSLELYEKIFARYGNMFYLDLMKFKAMTLLPTQSGFFFGDTEYDEWYIRQLQDTVVILEDVLATTDFDKELVAYQSSW